MVEVLFDDFCHDEEVAGLARSVLKSLSLGQPSLFSVRSEHIKNGRRMVHRSDAFHIYLFQLLYVPQDPL